MLLLSIREYQPLSQHMLSMLRQAPASASAVALVSGVQVHLEASATQEPLGHSRPRVPVMG